MQSLSSEMYKSYGQRLNKKNSKQNTSQQQQQSQSQQQQQVNSQPKQQQQQSKQSQQQQQYQKQSSQTSKFPIVQEQQLQTEDFSVVQEVQEKEIYESLFGAITSQAAPSTLYSKLGLQAQVYSGIPLASVDLQGTNNFFPPSKRGTNYLTFCCNGNRQPLMAKDIINIIHQYSKHETKFCNTINQLLAEDSSQIGQHGEYIKNLKWCIAKLANQFPVQVTECYRTVQCATEDEFNSFEREKTIFMPTFLSATKDFNNLFYQQQQQNTLLVIKLKYIPANACMLSNRFSAYSTKEDEMLFTCYAKFKVLKKEKNKTVNGKNFEYYIELLHINDFFVSK